MIFEIDEVSEKMRSVFVVTTLFVILGLLGLSFVMLADGMSLFIVFGVNLGLFALIDCSVYLIAVGESTESENSEGKQ